jgi:small subunit ribosomal protein S17
MEKKQKIRLGRVLSHKMDKTALVEVETRRRHPRFKRVVSYRAKFKVHDENNTCGVGDLVKIVETRPLSKEKRWRVIEILAKAEAVEIKPSEIE